MRYLTVPRAFITALEGPPGCLAKGNLDLSHTTAKYMAFKRQKTASPILMQSTPMFQNEPYRQSRSLYSRRGPILVNLCVDFGISVRSHLGESENAGRTAADIADNREVCLGIDGDGHDALRYMDHMVDPHSKTTCMLTD